MRILLAEDEKRMAAALTALFKQEKYDVRPCGGRGVRPGGAGERRV